MFFQMKYAACCGFATALVGGSHGQLRLEMVVECPPNVSARNLAASSLMGEQREVLALITPRWIESSACEEGALRFT